MRPFLPLPARAELDRILAGSEPTLVHLVGGAGSGKTVLLSRLLAGREGSALHWVLSPLEEGGLLAELDALVRETVGALPAVDRPDLLPRRGSGFEWSLRFEGILERLAGGEGERASAPGVLAVDGAELLAGAGRRGVEALAESWARVRERGRPVHLVLGWREAPGEASPLGALQGERLDLGRLPFREVAWRQLGEPVRPSGAGKGTRKEGDPGRALQAMVAWSVFGDHPAHLPGAGGRRRGGDPSPEEGVLGRILHPGGDLHDRPLRELERAFQSPRRYAGILAAMAGGATTWGGLARAMGEGAGNTLAPYLARLESAGWIRVEEPLDGPRGGRRRRYTLVDPFHHFWFGEVLPLRSLLRRQDPEALFRSRIEPKLLRHAAGWLPELARRWLRRHAPERLPSSAREVGALWADGVDIPVAARLRGGQIVYGVSDPGPGRTDPDTGLLSHLEGAMREVRWGLGRETRIPLVVLLSPPSPELVRQVARTGTGVILTPLELLTSPGDAPPGDASSSNSGRP